MAMTLKEVEIIARELTIEEQEMLALNILASLDEKTDPEIERLWAEEAERRAQEIIEGKAKTFNGDEVMAKVRKMADEKNQISRSGA